MTSSHRRFGPWRRAFQWSLAALLAATPFLSTQDVAILRLDIPALTLELAGHRFRIEELYLVWLFILSLIFLFLLTTLLLGRVWCGWACPQTALSDLGEWLYRRQWPQVIRHLGFLLVSLWSGATFVWYFMAPAEYLTLLAGGQLGVWPLGTTVVIASMVFIDLTMIRRLFCRDFCPYGRFQTILLDRGTLTLQAKAEDLRRCIDCKSCLRVCPTGIDIRAGYQIECINCARCIDACRKVMARRGEEGIIRYTFGQADLGWTSIFSVKTLALALIALTLGSATLFLASHRPTASFKIGRAAQLPSRLTGNGRQQTFFNGSIANRRETQEEFTITVSGSAEQTLSIKGPATFTLAGNEKRDITLAVDSPRIPGPAPMPITFVLATAAGGPPLTIAAYLTPAADSGANTPK